jgi:hypothetical protein
MPPHGKRPNSTQGVMVLELLDELERDHGSGGVPFKALEVAARHRMDFRTLTGSLDLLAKSGSVIRTADTPPRIKLTQAGRSELQEYRD